MDQCIKERSELDPPSPLEPDLNPMKHQFDVCVNAEGSISSDSDESESEIRVGFPVIHLPNLEILMLLGGAVQP